MQALRGSRIGLRLQAAKAANTARGGIEMVFCHSATIWLSADPDAGGKGKRGGTEGDCDGVMSLSSSWNADGDEETGPGRAEV